MWKLQIWISSKVNGAGLWNFSQRQLSSFETWTRKDFSQVWLFSILLTFFQKKCALTWSRIEKNKKFNIFKNKGISSLKLCPQTALCTWSLEPKAFRSDMDSYCIYSFYSKKCFWPLSYPPLTAIEENAHVFMRMPALYKLTLWCD